MGEIKRPPVKIIQGGIEYAAFDEDHTLADIARWIEENQADAEELVCLLTEATLPSRDEQAVGEGLADELARMAALGPFRLEDASAIPAGAWIADARAIMAMAATALRAAKPADEGPRELLREARDAADGILAPLCADVGRYMREDPAGDAIETMHSYGVEIPFSAFQRLYDATDHERIDAALSETVK